MNGTVKVVKRGKQFDVVLDGRVIEGGFFTYEAACKAADELRMELSKPRNA